MIILGLNYYHPDASASLIKDGKVLSAVDEERFIRLKHYSGFPKKAISYCLSHANIQLSEVDFIAVNFNPKANFLDKMNFTLKNITKYSTLKKINNFIGRIVKKNNLKDYLNKNGFKGKIINVEHHISHLSSSLFVSGFNSSVGLTIDGFGDFCSMESYFFKSNKINKIKNVLFPHSLGIFYQAITQYLGFSKYGDEYKVMGLASYGNPKYLDEFSKIIKFCKKNYFKLNLEFFSHHIDKNFKFSFDDGIPKFNKLYSTKLIELFGPEREQNEEINQKHKDIAASMQKCFEKIIIKILNNIYEEYPNDNLCLAGGCAFNSKLNGLIKKNTNFKNVFIQPNAGDGGGSLGAALYVNYIYNSKKEYKNKNLIYLGPSFENDEIYEIIKSYKNLENFKIKKLHDDEVYNITAKKIIDNKVVGWFRGRMEWGPRALGNRSILANPSNKNINDILNLKIKLREKFRPFAPAILNEYKEDYFELNYESPFMLNVVNAKNLAKKKIPAVVHVDNTCRVQTVKKEDNLHFYNLIFELYKISGIPVVLNTSFNENEPIVLNPREAIDCFLRTKMDFLVLENWTISR